MVPCKLVAFLHRQGIETCLEMEPIVSVLEEIHLNQFRCFGSLVFQPGSHNNFIVGCNAQGKTSLLEAICVLLRLQSPRTVTLSQAIHYGQVGFGLGGVCSGFHLQFRQEIGHRTLWLNSVEQSSARQYLSVARVTWFANSDSELIRGGAEARRRYLDFMGVQTDPEYLLHLRAYERAWKSRNLLLKESARREEVHAFDGPLAIAGEAIAARRLSIVHELAPLFLQATRDISGCDEAWSICYQPGFQSDLYKELLASEHEERRLRHTVVGIHRDELRLLLSGNAANTFASEGQQRTIALALKLAQVRLLTKRTGCVPILLLDDVFGELDVERRERLLVYLPIEAQKIIAVTSLKWMEIPGAAIFQIEQGRFV